jgi:hypothetical protein
MVVFLDSQNCRILGLSDSRNCWIIGLVFPSPLLMPSKLFQVSQISKDACRLDGEYLLSSLLAWSGHPPPISYSRHTKLSKYILWFYLRVFERLDGCQGSLKIDRLYHYHRNQNITHDKDDILKFWLHILILHRKWVLEMYHMSYADVI